MDCDLNQYLNNEDRWFADREFLFRKQKSLRRVLLDRAVNGIPIRIAFLNGSTTTEIKNLLEIFLLQAGIRPQFYESEYNRYYEDAVFSNKALDDFRPDIVIVFTSVVNLHSWPDLQDDEKTVSDKVESVYAHYREIWSALSKKYSSMIIQNNFELPYEYPLGGVVESTLACGKCRFVHAINEKIAQYASAHKNFFLHDLHALSSWVGLSTWHNRSQYYDYKFAMDHDAMPDVANSLAKIVKASLGKTKKCLVLDLDYTLWGGVIGDDGVNGLSIGHETPEGEAYTEFQSYVKQLKGRGILLAVCSKNEEEIAKTGFSHPDSVLKVDDFIVFKANWRPKNVNLQEIAQEIGIGTDSLVFLDDNPVERQLIRDTMPEVAVPEIDAADVSSYIRAIEAGGYFDVLSISHDDLQRNEAYQGNKMRENLQHSAASYDEFLMSLDMHAEIAPFKDVYLERIAQLTNKTNQFNLTTRRYTLAEIQQIAMDEKYITLYGRLRDKFGDNGLVSVVIGEKHGNELHLILWLMSCRVLKRGMEHTMLDALVRYARQDGIVKLIGYYYSTKKNHMVSELYRELGFQLIRSDEAGTVWERQVDEYVDQGKYIVVD